MGSRLEQPCPHTGAVMSITGHVEFVRSEYADARRRFAKSKAELDAFEVRMEGLGIPKWEWRRQVLQCLIQLKREWEHDLKNVLRLGKELLAFEAKVAAAKVTEKPEEKFSVTYDQMVDVRVVDGKTVTNFRPDGAHWLKVNAWCMAKSFQRIFRFFDKVIPPEYEFVLQDNFYRYGPTEMVYIEYETEEFKRMCHHEEDIQSEHALDGERLRYWRRRDKEPIGVVRDEEKGSES